MRFVSLLTSFALLRASKRNRDSSDLPSEVEHPNKKLHTDQEVLLQDYVPFDALSLIFHHFLDGNVENGISWTSSLVTFRAVCKSYCACSESMSFDKILSEHTATACDWIVRNHGIVGQASGMERVRIFRKLFTRSHCISLVQNAIDVESVLELVEFPGLIDGDFPNPVASLLNGVHTSDQLKMLLVKMSDSYPKLFQEVDAESSVPVLFQISFLSLVKVMGLEMVDSVHRLTPSFLLVMRSITYLWRQPEYQQQIRELVGKLEHIRFLPEQQSCSCSLKALTLPLVLAALSGERDFATILPESFFQNQIALHSNNTAIIEMLQTLSDYYAGTRTSIDCSFLEQYYWHMVDEPVFGFQDFNTQILADLLEEYFSRPLVYHFTISMLFFKGIGNELEY